MLIDTHCHLHDSEFFVDDREEVYQRAINDNLKMLCIGTSQADSRAAIAFTKNRPETWAVVGVHPHDSKNGVSDVGSILKERHPKVVGVGEIGLDYYYDNSPRDVQVAALEQQLQWASDYQLPVSFHVRGAYDDFWPIINNFPGIRGVLHSYTDNIENAQLAISKGLYIGVNGISTFARDKQAMFDMIPLENILLETDAPFLTPTPHRGKVNEPAFVRHVAEYHAERRQIELETIALVTSANATTLFSL